jgi:hypothetical protein
MTRVVSGKLKINIRHAEVRPKAAFKHVSANVRTPLFKQSLRPLVRGRHVRRNSNDAPIVEVAPGATLSLATALG